jgi:histidyl-tRNA synthetase
MQTYQPLIGMQDLSGIDLRRQQYLRALFMGLLERCGYQFVEPSLLERAASFDKSVVGSSPWPEWNDKGVIMVDDVVYGDDYQRKNSSTPAVLIPEGTISVARMVAGMVAENRDFAFPMKTAYVLPCFRNELEATLGRTKRRQFTQLGVELVGAPAGDSDVEAIYLIHSCLREFGVDAKHIKVRVGDVAIFNRLVALSRINASDAILLKELLDAIAECRAGKMSHRHQALETEMLQLLTRVQVADRYKEAWIGITKGMSTVEFAGQVEDDDVWKGVERLNSLVETLIGLGCTIVPDLCVVRSHEYYSGIAFEIDVITEASSFVEVGGGGRYDKLIGHFLSEDLPRSVPATGFAFGLERIVQLLQTLNLLTPDGGAARGPLTGKWRIPRGSKVRRTNACLRHSHRHLSRRTRAVRCIRQAGGLHRKGNRAMLVNSTS